MIGAVLALATLHVLPRPQQIAPAGCAYVSPPRSVARSFDPAALDELNERWTALGIPEVRADGGAQISVTRVPSMAPQSYRLTIDRAGIRIEGGDDAGAFYAAMTLAQLPAPHSGRWFLPCVTIDDRPALEWRILSDDVSRGPLPTMRYFEERIRTIAAFKMNGYSPYMEHVVRTVADPLPAPLDGLTPEQLAQLDAYARRFHVTFIPEQQTFAHMHNTLRVEEYAPAAELPHGFLISPDVAVGTAYLARLIRQERLAVPDSPFFHIGSDETATLGEGRTRDYVASHGGRSAVFADHVNEMARLVAPARVMLWDDGIEGDPTIMRRIPKDAVIVNWHYGANEPFEKYIATIAGGGLQQMVAPGANNWNEIFPDVNRAIPNERRFINDGKASHVFGLFQTVWHDDGETLYEATWYPVLYAAAAAWETDDVDPARFRSDFPAAFFGSDDARYGDDVQRLADALTAIGGPSNVRFWADPFDPWWAGQMANVDLRAVRLNAEAVETHLMFAEPPLHPNAARVMFLAARRYDALARRYQIAREVRDYYDDGRKHANEQNGPSVRDLFWSKYWFWEQRDSDEELAPLYADAWQYESRPGHLASNLERYHRDAQLAIARADAINRITYSDLVDKRSLPPFDDVIGPEKP
jgi:hypothetical protein